MAGMIPTSARPAFRPSAHCEGTANERSYRPASGPSVKPQTSGAVFRNSTIEMRNLSIFTHVRGQFTIAQHTRPPNGAGMLPAGERAKNSMSRRADSLQRNITYAGKSDLFD